MQIQHYLDQKGNGERVSHIVVMGIGEPFDNYDNVIAFLNIVNHAKGLAIGARHITVSTSGLAPKIREFAENGLQVNLALSLHAPNDEIRSRMMRINRKHPLKEVMSAIDEYLEKTNRRITFEYIMISGVNDRPEQAHELVALLKDKRHLSYVNLILTIRLPSTSNTSAAPKRIFWHSMISSKRTTSTASSARSTAPTSMPPAANCAANIWKKQLNN